ncbi:MAG: cell wall biosynthesis protein [Methanobacterium sp.]|uniref:cell wall biosynthesis protein n=1 Tax=Methanobacterium sp. TaxID=2164 RepID=UPI003D6564C1|nr:cell wall biosynthesis protein [Methanobacterium sp.]
MYTEIIFTFLISAVLTLLLKWIIQKSGGSLYTTIRGGTPRAVGIAPFIAMVIFLPIPYNYLIAIIGIFALFDDIIGRKKIKNISIEIGQISRGIGMLLVIAVGYYYLGPVSILIGLMIQPLNIADMQPGAACSTIITMCFIVIVSMILAGFNGLIVPLIILAACIGYAPLDYKGKVMMGEVGNHSFAVGLGIAYAILGGALGMYYGIGYIYGSFFVTLALFLITVLVIAFIRRGTLKIFLEKKLGIENPHYFDYVMDVLTGGGLGDLLRRILIGKRDIVVKRNIFKVLGFRRLFYNPYAEN